MPNVTQKDDDRDRISTEICSRAAGHTYRSMGPAGLVGIQSSGTEWGNQKQTERTSATKKQSSCHSRVRSKRSPQ